MNLTLRTPDVAELRTAVRELAAWQRDDAPMQLHPGDLGWACARGEAATADAVRTWHAQDRLVAVGFLDDGVLRLTTAPELRGDTAIAGAILGDAADPARGVLPAGEASIETPDGSALVALALEAGWSLGEAWTPLVRDLAEPVEDPGFEVVVVDDALAEVRTAVHRASFDGSRLSAAHWRAMASAPVYADACCLVLMDDAGRPAAAATVWSAGAGRPGLLEPLGVDRERRGLGLGRAVSLAAAAALRDLGASSALVCTPSANTVAVATYRAAGFRSMPERLDLHRGA